MANKIVIGIRLAYATDISLVKKNLLQIFCGRVFPSDTSILLLIASLSLGFPIGACTFFRGFWADSSRTRLVHRNRVILYQRKRIMIKS